MACVSVVYLGGGVHAVLEPGRTLIGLMDEAGTETIHLDRDAFAELLRFGRDHGFEDLVVHGAVAR